MYEYVSTQACGRGGVSKARVELVIVAHMARSFVDSLMLEALDLPFE